MLRTLKEPEVVRSGSQEQYIQAFKWMLLARTVEEKLASLWRAGKIAGGMYIGKGQEAISAPLGMALKPGDIYGPLIRDQAGRLAFGEPLEDIVRTYLGSSLGPTRGHDGNVHRGRLHAHQYAMISHLGTMISTIAGGLIARRIRGESGIVGATCIGEGGTSTGAFHEGLNLASVENLPLILVVTNNQYSYSTPNEKQFACANLVDRALGYGMEGYTMDGLNLQECLEVVSNAVERARSGHGPQMIVATCLRLSGHGEHDDAFYVDPKLKASPIGRDCLKVTEEFLLTESWAAQSEIDQLKEEAKAQVEDTVQKVNSEPQPDPVNKVWEAISTHRLTESPSQA
jgi:acetoin:2,6-dichlorophenolindophenol oxidoreductase subunit alpha